MEQGTRPVVADTGGAISRHSQQASVHFMVVMKKTDLINNIASGTMGVHDALEPTRGASGLSLEEVVTLPDFHIGFLARTRCENLFEIEHAFGNLSPHDNDIPDLQIVLDILNER